MHPSLKHIRNGMVGFSVHRENIGPAGYGKGIIRICKGLSPVHRLGQGKAGGRLYAPACFNGSHQAEPRIPTQDRFNRHAVRKDDLFRAVGLHRGDCLGAGWRSVGHSYLS